MSYEEMLLVLGQAMGALSIPSNAQALVESLCDGTLNPSYVTLLRDRLSECLRESGIKDD